jgi:hypothetical protein
LILGVDHTRSLFFPRLRNYQMQSARVYHRFFRAQAWSYMFFRREFHRTLADFIARASDLYLCSHALTNFSVLSNMRFVLGGSRGMLRASRCLGTVFLHLSRPATLSAAEPLPCSSPFADKSIAHNLFFLATNFFPLHRPKKSRHSCVRPQSAPQLHDPWGKGAALCVALG